MEDSYGGGPAFPNPGMYYVEDGKPKEINPPASGMTLLDYFAGVALKVAYEQYHRDATRQRDAQMYDNTLDVARVAYDLAKTMLAERAKREVSAWTASRA